MRRKSGVDESLLTALSSSDSEDDLHKSQSSIENPAVQNENMVTPTRHKKKKIKKEKAADMSASELSIRNTPKLLDEQDTKAQTPGSKKKKKKEAKSSKRRKSQSDDDENVEENEVLDSPERKLFTQDLEMHFTSSDVGSQDSPTQKDVQNILDSLDSSAPGETPKKSKKTPKKSKEKVQFEETAMEHDGKKDVQNILDSLDSSAPGETPKKSKKTPKKSKETVQFEETAISAMEHDGSQTNQESETDPSDRSLHKKSSKKKKKRKHSVSVSEGSMCSENEELLQKDASKNLSKIFESKPHTVDDDSLNSTSTTERKDSASNLPEMTVKTQSESSSSDSEPEEGATGVEAAKLLRYNPESFKEVSSFKAPWLEELQKKDTELWLIKVPEGCDVTFLEGEIITWNQKKVVKTENNKNEHFQSVWEMSANRISDKQDVNLTALVPSKTDKTFHSVGQIAGQITLTKGVKVPEYVMPQTGLKSPPRIPQGLKRRHQPFGAGNPMNSIKDDGPPSKSAKKKKKDKKHKHNQETDLDISFKKKKAKKEKTDEHL